MRADHSDKNIADLDDLACEHFTKGSDALDQGNLGAALKHYQGSLAIYRKLLAADPASVHWQEEMARIHMWVGAVLERQGKIGAARTRYQKSLAISRRLVAANPADARLRWSVACTQDRLAGALEEQGDLDGALRNHQGALATWRRLTVELPSVASSQGLADKLMDIGRILHAQGDLSGAAVHLHEALSVWQEVTQGESVDPVPQECLSLTHDRLGAVLLEQEDFAGALRHFRQALDIVRTLHWHEAEASCLESAGDALQGLGQLQEALEHYESCVDLSSRLAAPGGDSDSAERGHVAFLREKMGDTLYEMDDLPGALRNYLESLRIRRQLVREQPSSNPWQEDLAVSHAHIGSIMMACQDLSAAYRSYAQALAIRERLVVQCPSDSDVRSALTRSRENLEVVKARLLDSVGDRPRPPHSLH